MHASIASVQTTYSVYGARWNYAGNGDNLLCVCQGGYKKAFDSVDKGRLIAKLRGRLGDSADMACWERLILGTRATLISPWGQSDFELFTGIKQGSVESPSFFSLLMEEALEETAAKHEWVKRSSHLSGL